MKLTLNPITAVLLAAAIVGPARAADRYDKDDDCRSRNLAVIGLTADQRLLSFKESSPHKAKSSKGVTGLIDGDTALVGIDYRVQDGKLYGVGNAGGIYTLDPKTAVATFVNRLSVALSGASFGVDFNPAADRLRIVSDTGQNLRHNVNAGGVTLVDATLNYTAGTPAGGITGAAYTNNDLDPNTATTLYDLDATLDQVVIQSPPNNGSLAATGKFTVDSASATGFDIHSKLRDGVTVEVEALASLSSPTGTASLYSIHLPTGAVIWRGTFKSSDLVTDIAIPLDQL